MTRLRSAPERLSPMCCCVMAHFQKHTSVSTVERGLRRHVRLFNCFSSAEHPQFGDLKDVSRFQEDIVPIFHKSFPLVYFKGKKKSFPRVAKGTMQRCPCSFSRCPGLREISDHWSLPVPSLVCTLSNVRVWGRRVLAGTLQPKPEGKKRAPQI